MLQNIDLSKIASMQANRSTQHTTAYLKIRIKQL